jgi:succinate dehydrogenase / fumarate reductase, cytochrome b subunit
MMSRRTGFTSSIASKLLVGLTGGLLFLYLVLHIAGNALALFGPDTFNGYAHGLISNPLLVPIEVGLLLVFVTHLCRAVSITLDNRRARPVPYVRKRWAGPPSRKSLASTTMILSGLTLLVFIPVHLKMFKYGPQYGYGTPAVRDLYRLEMEVFRSPVTVGFYVAVMVVVGFHLWHGIPSAFQSLGLSGPRFTPFVLSLGRLLAVLIAGGFIGVALWAFLTGSSS